MPGMANSVSVISAPAKAGQRAADECHERNKRVAEGMVIDDLMLGKTLGAGGADVVGVEHLEHVRAHIAHPRADGNEHQRHDGQHQMLCHIEDLTKLAEELKSRPVRPTRSNQPSLMQKMSFKSVAKKNVGSDIPSSATVVTV